MPPAAAAAKAKTNGKRPTVAPASDTVKRQLLTVLRAVARGDFTVKLPTSWSGIDGDIAEAFNEVVAMDAQMVKEIERISTVVGAAGPWKGLTDSVNSMAGTLTNQIRNIADVTTAVANGNLSKKITVEARGEILQLKETINTMVDQLNTFAAEVTRVAREVGSEG